MKKVILLFIIHCSLLITACFSQQITWQRIFNNYYSFAKKTQQTSNGGYITVGGASINGYNKIYLIKQNIYGDTEWTRLIGGNRDDRAFWVENTIDDGYIIGGSTTSYGTGGTAGFLVKTDSLGFVQWQNVYDNPLAQIRCVKQTLDKGYILAIRWSVAGHDKIKLVKLDSSGNMVWQNIYGHMLDDGPSEVEIVNNSGYVVVGSSSPDYGNTSLVYVLRVSNSGDTLWSKYYGGSYSSDGSQIQNTNDRGFILCGVTNSFTNGVKFESYVVKTDSSGNIQWQKTYSNAGDESANAIRNIQNRGYIIAGNSDSLNNYFDNPKIRIIDKNGDLLHEYSFHPISDGGGFFYSVEVTNDKGFIISGEAVNIFDISYVYIVKTDSLGYALPIGIRQNSNNIPTQFKLYQNYPNPFNPKTKIRFSIPLIKGGLRGLSVRLVIYDILGREVASLILPLWGGQEGLKPGTYEVEFDGSNFASGIYFYKLIAGDFIQTKKMVLLK